MAVLAAVPLTRAVACSCSYETICSRVEQARVIFLGEVIDGGLEPRQDAWHGTANFAKLRVVERFRGVALDTAEVVVKLGFIPGMCAPMPYRKGEQTLVFLYPKNASDELFDGGCTQSRFAKDVPEQVDYARRYFKGDTLTTIRGRLAANTSDDSVDFTLDSNQGLPIAGARVIAERAEGKLSVVSDSHGSYEFTGLRPGVYTIRAEMEGYSSEDEDSEVVVTERGCAVQNLGLWSHNVLEGFVYDQKGQAVPEIRAFLQKPSQFDRWGNESRTNAQGQYRFEQIDPGRYYLVVSPRGATPDSPYDTLFYGGSTSREQAEAVDITPTSSLHGYNFVVSAALPRRALHVRLTWPNGQPVKYAHVECAESGAGERDWHRRELSSTRDEGLATCRVLAARDYRVSVKDLIDARETMVLAGSEDLQIQLRLGEKDYEQAMKRQRDVERRR